MLKTVDILLGLSVVMLIASMAVTVLTQFVISILNTRGRHLARGLGDLLQQIDPQLERNLADQLSTAILKHPMVSHMRDVPFLGVRLGDTIHREELTGLLMDMAAGQCFGLDTTLFPDTSREKLKGLLKANGIADPAATLDKVRSYALQLEQANPELATNKRQNIALMREANSRFVAKINNWFDQTMDRVSDRFTASTRVVTVLCSFLVVAAVQLDTIDVINRLAMDDHLREALVTKAMAIEQPQDSKQQGEEATSTNSGQQKFDVASVKNELLSLEELGVINIIGHGNETWLQHWCSVNPIGILLSVVMVSLGAPFWYGALKNLLKLRSGLASKDDEQRRERQTTQSTVPVLATAEDSRADSSLSGERGILG
ncbi:MAG: hypothetical protein LUQ11_16780 [Methylococcaceae bacterium]|nr:hypothetical protein [Methylococcaceae bacterium]